jgi:hypothetical protein
MLLLVPPLLLPLAAPVPSRGRGRRPVARPAAAQDGAPRLLAAARGAQLERLRVQRGEHWRGAAALLQLLLQRGARQQHGLQRRDACLPRARRGERGWVGSWLGRIWQICVRQTQCKQRIDCGLPCRRPAVPGGTLQDRSVRTAPRLRAAASAATTTRRSCSCCSRPAIPLTRSFFFFLPRFPGGSSLRIAPSRMVIDFDSTVLGVTELWNTRLADSGMGRSWRAATPSAAPHWSPWSRQPDAAARRCAVPRPKSSSPPPLPPPAVLTMNTGDGALPLAPKKPGRVPEAGPNDRTGCRARRSSGIVLVRDNGAVRAKTGRQRGARARARAATLRGGQSPWVWRVGGPAAVNGSVAPQARALSRNLIRNLIRWGPF